MEEHQKKDVGRAITTDEIRLQAQKWTLAGDVGLLAHLEQFSQSLLSRSQETQKNINELLDSFENTSTTISNVTNQFLALQNSQFVENRVYDDESPAEEPKNSSEVSKEEQEKLLLAQYKEAVEIGVQLLDSHFEEVQLPLNSDSDEEEVSVESSGLVWKPKNPYAGKRFPLLIGSAEWWADDNVGIGEFEENLNQDTFSPDSESDLDVEQTAEKRIRMSSSSDTESEIMMSSKPKPKIMPDFNDIFATPQKDVFTGENLFRDNIDNDLLEDEAEKPPKLITLPAEQNYENKCNSFTPKQEKCGSLFEEKTEHSDEENHPNADTNSQPNKFQNAFSRELAAKLSSVAKKTSKESSSPPTIVKHDNNTPVKKETSALFDENEDNDLFSAKNTAVKPIFKKGTLFSEDENDDDSLFKDEDDLFSESRKERPSGMAKPNSQKEREKSRSLVHDLFGNSDDNLFSGKTLLDRPESGVSDWKAAQEVKFSTPTEGERNQEVPNADNIFGQLSVPSTKSDRSPQVEEPSNIVRDVNNAFSFPSYPSKGSMKDHGFEDGSEHSNNTNEKSSVFESPRLFEPPHSSARGSVPDTSDYHTESIPSANDVPSNSIESRPSMDNGEKSKMGHSEKVHFPREDNSKLECLFADDEDELFRNDKKKSSLNILFKNVENDDLFSNLVQPNDEEDPVLFEEKEQYSVLFDSYVHKSPGEEEEKPSMDKLKQQDSVSMSSSRSSLFDDVSMSRSNLASVFDRDLSSDNLFSAGKDNLFKNDKTDLFSDSLNRKSEKRNLFEDVSDDDLFGSDRPKKKIEESLFPKTDTEPSFIGGSDNKDEKMEDSKSIQNSVKEVGVKSKNLDKKFSSLSSAAPDTGSEKDRSKDGHISESEDSKKISINDSKDFGEYSRDAPGCNAGLDNESENCKIESPFLDNESKEDEVLFTSEGLSDQKIGNSLDNSKSGFNGSRISSTETDNLFDSKPRTKLIGSFIEEEADDLFSGKKSIVQNDDDYDSLFKKESKSKSKSSSILFDEDEDEDLFGDGKKKNKGQENKLFDNTQDDVDIFAVVAPNDRGDFVGKPRIPSLKPKEGIGRKGGEGDRIAILKENTRSKTLINEDIFDGKRAEEGLFRPSPPNSLNIAKKISLIAEQDRTDGGVASKPKVVGKLNIPVNLKINPMNLLPDAVMKKTAPPEKSVDVAENPEKETTSPRLLKCLNKDRARIQVKRRPQTRRARHEALRSSGIDFKLDGNEFGDVQESMRSSKSAEELPVSPGVNGPSLVKTDSESEGKAVETTESSSSIFHSVENSPDGLFSSPMQSNPLSPSTDEEDYFNVPELDVNFEREDQSIFKANPKDDGLLFDGAPVLSPLSPTKPIMSEPDTKKSAIAVSKILKNRVILGDDEDEDVDDALFKSKDEVPQSKTNIFGDSDDDDSNLFGGKGSNVLTSREPPKKSLFDDEENNGNDDLFGDVYSSSKKPNKGSFSKVTKPDSPEKSKEPFVDPLGLMTNPD